MSAALALAIPTHTPHDGTSPAPLDRPAGMPLGRPQLRLVPTGALVSGRPERVRMTRRGRLVRTGVAVAIALVLTWTVVGAVAAGAMAPHIVTVTRGQTLSQIATQQLPGLPVRDGVAAIQLANGLSTSDIHAGQVLTVPDAG